MKWRKYWAVSAIVMLAALAVGLFVATSSAGASHTNSGKLRVTVTNITKGQIISPIVVATHDGQTVPLFRLGAPAQSRAR